MSKMFTILVNYRNFQDTFDCLISLLDNEDKDNTIVIVDNSEDLDSYKSFLSYVDKGVFHTTDKKICFFAIGSGEEIDKNSNIYYLYNAPNFGFGPANNLGVKFVENNFDYDYLWFLNNDTEINSTTLSSMLEKFSLEDNVGIVGSVLTYFDDREVIQSYGGEYNKLIGKLRPIGVLEKLDSLSSSWTENIDYIEGASMLASRNFIEDVGLMNENLFLYFEELDWCIRARKLGYRVGVSLDSVVYHKGGSTTTSTKSLSRLAKYYYLRNRIKIAKIHFPSTVFSIRMMILLVSIKYLFVGEVYSFKAAIKALSDG